MLRKIFPSSISFARQTQAPPREEEHETMAQKDNKLRLTSLLQVFCASCRELDERCTVRFKLAPKLTNNRRPGQRTQLQLHRNFAELEGCAAEGCSACLVWRKILLRECPTTEMESDLKKGKSAIWAVLSAMLSEPWTITIETQTRAGEALSAIAVLQDSADTPGKPT
jgi:hypothetical protein